MGTGGTLLARSQGGPVWKSVFEGSKQVPWGPESLSRVASSPLRAAMETGPTPGPPPPHPGPPPHTHPPVPPPHTRGCRPPLTPPPQTEAPAHTSTLLFPIPKLGCYFLQLK